MNFSIRTTRQFDKDIVLAKKRGLPLEQLERVIRLLQNGSPLPINYKDHSLAGNYKGYRECHVLTD